MKKIQKLLSFLRKKFIKLSSKTLMTMLCIAFAGSIVLTVYHWMSVSYIKTMVITLNYEGAKSGLNPDGSRFKITEIKSERVLENAIDKTGDSSLSTESLRERIFIDSKMPLSAIEKTSASIAQGALYSYTPTEFDIYYSQKNKFSRNNSHEMLSALAEAYREYFNEEYCEKNLILEFDENTDFSDYDYYEIQKILEDKINSMVSHLARHQEENAAFRSATTGYSFKNLTNMLLNLKNQDLARLKAYIVQNNISHNKSKFIKKQEILIDRDNNQYKSNMQASDITNAALEVYDPYITGVTFIPSIDQYDEYYMSRTKTGIDNLALRSYNQGITANKFKKNIDSRKYLVNKFSKEESGGSTAEADRMISELCSHLSKLSSVSLLTDDEYIDAKTKKYLTVKLPEDSLYFPLVKFVIYFILLFAVIFIAFRAYIFSLDYIKKKGDAIKEKYIITDEDE